MMSAQRLTTAARTGPFILKFVKKAHGCTVAQGRGHVLDRHYKTHVPDTCLNFDHTGDRQL